MALCHTALGCDGYVSVESELKGALKKEDLVASMMHEALCKHQVWPTLVQQVPLLQKLDAMVDIMVYVMCASLSKTQAWKVLEQVEARSLDLQDVSSVAPWLLELGCAREVVESQWSILVERCVQMAEAKSREAAHIIRHLVDEWLNDKFASIDRSSTKQLLAMMPPQIHFEERAGRAFPTRREVHTGCESWIFGTGG